MIHIRGSVF